MAKRTGKTLLARRYAVALFELYQGKKEAATLAEELSALAQAMQDSQELYSVATNPSLPVEQVLPALEVILTKAGASKAASRFVAVLAENRRLSLLPEILTAYKLLVAEANNEMTAEITSAAPLSAAQQKDVAAELTKITGKTIAIVQKTNPALLGGMTVKLGSRLLDASVAGKLNRLEQELKRA